MRWPFGARRERETDTAIADRAERAPSVHPEFDEAIDTVGALLRTVGRLPLGLEETGATKHVFERWALHVLTRAPRPDDAQPISERPEAARRDWGALRHFFLAHRKAEAEKVARTARDLRAVVWAFVQSLAGIMKQDGESDARMLGELERLRAVAASGSTSELRTQAVTLADTLSAVLAERGERQRGAMAELGERLSTLGAELEQAKRDGNEDPLTRIQNRRAFDEYITRTAELRHAFASPALLFLVDIDHFKAVNDTFGHPAGDEVLKAIANTLTRTFLRRCDFVARYGGEEFAVVLRDARREDAAAMAARLRDAVFATRVLHGEKTIRVTVSIGVAEVGDESAADWIARADRALYEAKKTGRDRAVIAPAVAL